MLSSGSLRIVVRVTALLACERPSPTAQALAMPRYEIKPAVGMVLPPMTSSGCRRPAARTISTVHPPAWLGIAISPPRGISISVADQSEDRFAELRASAGLDAVPT